VIAGTFIGGLSIYCGSQLRLPHMNKIHVTLINTWVAFLQLITTPFFLIGWIWSGFWSTNFITISSELLMPVELFHSLEHS